MTVQILIIANSDGLDKGFQYVYSHKTLAFFSALLYAAFFVWYTDLGGPLSDAEVDEYVATMKANGGAPETIAYPIETSLYLGDPRLLLGLILLAVTALVDAWRSSRANRD